MRFYVVAIYYFAKWPVLVNYYRGLVTCVSIEPRGSSHAADRFTLFSVKLAGNGQSARCAHMHTWIYSPRIRR